MVDVGKLCAEGHALRQLLPCIALLATSILGAGVLYGCEKYGEITDKCPLIAGFDEALFFVNTVHTTIGYGNIFPCTPAGKIVTIIYAVISLPIFLIMVNNLGKICFAIATKAWRYIAAPSLLVYNNNKHVTSENTGDDTIPVWLALLLTVAWMSIAAAFFYALEGSEDYFTWIYFTFISISTIGFGDVAPSKFGYTVLHFAFITIGLCLFSMTLNVIQSKLENLSNMVAKLIAKQYQEALLSDEQFMSTEPEVAKRAIKRMIRSQKLGFLLEKFMGQKAKERLIKTYTQFAKMRTVALQTEEKFHIDREVQCTLHSSSPEDYSDYRAGYAAGWAFVHHKYSMHRMRKVSQL